ncbi:hypothetical protein EVAR_98150_1 [Eumeta japonica]|uniref:Uncharacterized protein n=1 Tax=Eumeta variegata TaxID=151549 RepID=A0A4C1XTM1_EUMVA|nr:hypothetical protein EVAR_98150_1 [Eumeta japonica]
MIRSKSAPVEPSLVIANLERRPPASELAGATSKSKITKKKEEEASPGRENASPRRAPGPAPARPPARPFILHGRAGMDRTAMCFYCIAPLNIGLRTNRRRGDAVCTSRMGPGLFRLLAHGVILMMERQKTDSLKNHGGIQFNHIIRDRVRWRNCTALVGHEARESTRADSMRRLFFDFIRCVKVKTKRRES